MLSKILILYCAFNDSVAFEFPIELVSNQPLEKVLEIIFRQCNHVDGNEWIANKSLRSLSVGDLVTFFYSEENEGDWIVYRCENVGWKRIGASFGGKEMR